MRYLILSLTTNCDEGDSIPREKQEVIELAALEMPSPRATPTHAFETLVRPVANPRLSALCLRVTGLSQSDADRADPFGLAFRQFLEWAGGDEASICTWGSFEQEQLQRDCQRHRVALPAPLERHINLKDAYARWRSVAPLGLAAALRAENLTPLPRVPRAMDTARAVARLARLVLPILEAPKRDISNTEKPRRRRHLGANTP